MRSKKIVIIKEELINDANSMLVDLMAGKGYKLVNYKNEEVWKKGKGILTAPRFMKFTFLEANKLQMEAWIKTAILPGIYVGESGLESKYGFAIKKELEFLVKRVYEILSI